VDPSTTFFVTRVHDSGFLDIAPMNLRHTWWNKGVGVDMISKRLDRFLLAEGFMSDNVRVRKWVGIGGDSNHFPILLEVAVTREKPPSPFKLNLWFENEEFTNLVKSQ
jgi:hypothetical protein